jgi:predicted nucleic acid-binding protein
MWLLDTVTISETSKINRNPGVVRWFLSVPVESLHTSVLCIGELERGIARLPEGQKRHSLEEWLAGGLPAWFGARIHDLDRAAAAEWGRMGAHADRNPIDSLIAATAKTRGLAIVTRNVRDFDGLGVPVVNPWT